MMHGQQNIKKNSENLFQCTLRRCAIGGAVPTFTTLTLSLSTIRWQIITFIPWPRGFHYPWNFRLRGPPETGQSIGSKDLPLFACSKVCLQAHGGTDCHDG